MKTNRIYAALMATAATLGLSGCIDTVEPQGYGTGEMQASAGQISASSTALEAAVNGIPSQMVQWYLIYGSQVHETDMGYPQFMIAQTELLGDMYPGGTDSGYDWFRTYNVSPASGSMSETSYFAYVPWVTLYKFIKTANDVIGAVDLENEDTTDEMKAYAGMAYAARAFDYYMLTVLFEPVDNIYTDCSNVLGLTVPIVTETTTVEESKTTPA